MNEEVEEHHMWMETGEALCEDPFANEGFILVRTQIVVCSRCRDVLNWLFS